MRREASSETRTRPGAASARPLFDEAVQRHKAGDIAEARRLYQAALELSPPSRLASDILTNVGALLRQEQDLAGAEASFNEAVRLAPANGAAWANLGNLLVLLLRYEEAEAAYLRALAVSPNDEALKYRLGLSHLGMGRYDTGFALYELREDRPATVLRQLSFPEWDGGPLEGRSVFVWREQGYGDELMMARFIPMLKKAGAGRVTVAPTAALIRLFSTLEGVDRVEQLVGRVTIPAHDVWVLPCSLPHKLGVMLETLPGAAYLSAPEEARAKWRGFAEPGSVGFVWHGNPAQPVERYRGLPSPDLLKPLERHVRLIDLQEPRGDFADTAAILEQLDLVITTDTAMAHLAGAMGRPCWLMTAAVGADWRWLRERTDAPWYPSMRLFRQPKPGDWASVVAAMEVELARRGAG